MAMSADTPLFEGFVDTTMDALRLIEVRTVTGLVDTAFVDSADWKNVHRLHVLLGPCRTARQREEG